LALIVNFTGYPLRQQTLKLLSNPILLFSPIDNTRSRYHDSNILFIGAGVKGYHVDGTDDLDEQVSMKNWPIGNEYPLLREKRRILDDYLGRAKMTATAIKNADAEANVVLIAET